MVQEKRSDETLFDENTLTRLRAVGGTSDVDASNPAEHWLRFALANAPIVLFGIDSSGRFTLSEGQALRSMGLAPGEVVGADATALFGPVPVVDPSGERITGRDLIERAFAGQTCGGVADIGGATFDAKLVPMRDATGEVQSVLGVATDLSEVTRAEQARRATEDAFRAFLEGSPDLVLMHRDGIVVYANRRAATALGYATAGAMQGLNLDQVLVVDGSSSAFATSTREMAMRQARGDLVPVEIITVDVTWEGAPAEAVVARDIGERRRSQAHLLQTDRLAALGSLAGGIAHEITNPLTYVMTNLELVSQAVLSAASELRAASPSVAASVADHLAALAGPLRSALDGAARVRNIARDLRTFARTELDTRQILDVRSVLMPAVQLTMNEIRHRARFERDMQDVPLVRANGTRLGQVFLNLLLNAAQAIPEGRSDEHSIRVATATDAEGHAVVSVSDTGCGIPKEHFARIFDPFFSTKPPGVGLGLGLSVCLGTVHALGGSIEVTSEPMQGTTFRVRLPPVILERQRDSVRTPPLKRPAVRARVLVVDDEPLIGDSLMRLLGEQHNVTAVTTSAEALALLDANPNFDLVLCDVMMPGQSGMDLFASIAARHPGLRDRVVFMTGGAFTPEARAFLAHVPNHRLEKPFDPGELELLVASMARET